MIPGLHGDDSLDIRGILRRVKVGNLTGRPDPEESVQADAEITLVQSEQRCIRRQIDASRLRSGGGHYLRTQGDACALNVCNCNDRV